MTQNVRLQNLRDFTVQIRNEADQIVGTGIAVSMDGKVVTCAHVVQAAIGVHPRDVNGAEVGIYFPQVRSGEEKKRRAKVDCCFREHDDDMVLLQLIEGSSPLAPEQIAVLGMADQSEGNPFSAAMSSAGARMTSRPWGPTRQGISSVPACFPRW